MGMGGWGKGGRGGLLRTVLVLGAQKIKTLGRFFTEVPPEQYLLQISSFLLEEIP